MHKSTVVFILLAGGLAHADSGPRLWHGAPVIKGKLDANVLAAAIKKSEAPLLDCFLKNADPSVGDGAVTVTFTLQPDGALANVAASGIAKPVETCVAGIVAKIKLDKPKDGAVTVSYPLSFVRDMATFATIKGTSGDSSAGFSDQDSGTLGSGPTFGSGYGVGSDGRHGPRTNEPQIRLDLPTVKGDLDTGIIRRYIKRNVQKIRYCYEKQLLVDDKIKGTVTSQFTIGTDGKVTAATSTGMNKTVAECIQTVISRIEFPKPKAGEVVVTYPFTFTPPVAEKPKKKLPAKK